MSKSERPRGQGQASFTATPLTLNRTETDASFNNTVRYPTDCEEVRADLSVDNLIHRLEALASFFGGQDGRDYSGGSTSLADEFLPLYLHLADEEFLSHPSEHVRILVACCIADFFRIYSPQSPYSDPKQLKTIFNFFIKQLEGLKDPEDAVLFERCLCLFENLARSKSFSLCFELDTDDAQDIFCAPFKLYFQIVGNKHLEKVRSRMTNMLCSLLTESETVSNTLLGIIFDNFVEPAKTSNLWAYKLAKEIVIKCWDILEPYMPDFLNGVTNWAWKVYHLILELDHTCHSILLAVIPSLENKLKSSNEVERHRTASLLGKMFSKKDSDLSMKYSQLWRAFLNLFDDDSSLIRVTCVQFTINFLINHPKLREDILEALKNIEHDADVSVRLEIVKSIVGTAVLDFNFVTECKQLLNFIKESTLDEEGKIRWEALKGLALIYKSHLTASYVSPSAKIAVKWIKDKILQSYFSASLKDRILVERLLNTCLVPYPSDSYDRMLKLLFLYGTLDDASSKAFLELQKNRLLVRLSMADLLIAIRNRKKVRQVDSEREISVRISRLIKVLPVNPTRASEFLHKLTSSLQDDSRLVNTLEIMVSPFTNCKTVAKSMHSFLNKFQPPVMEDTDHNILKLLLERAACVLIDKKAILKLVTIVNEIATGTTEILAMLGLDKMNALERGLKLTSELALIFPSHFLNEQTLVILVLLLCNNRRKLELNLQRLLMKCLICIGIIKPLGEFQPHLMNVLKTYCQKVLADCSSPKLGKDVVRVMFYNLTESAKQSSFSQVILTLEANLDSKNSNSWTAIVALGHIALLIPEEFKHKLSILFSQKIIKVLLLNPIRTEEDRLKNSENWCNEEDLPEITLCMVSGMKATVRWILGLKNYFQSASKILQTLFTFVNTEEDVVQGRIPYSAAEKSWLRLTAGCCILKMCGKKCTGDQLTPGQFYMLSKLMNDSVLEVRSRFASKLHRGLSRGIPQNCLPLDFMGFYSLAGHEKDKEQKSRVRSYMMRDVGARREYIKYKMDTKTRATAEVNKNVDKQLHNILPDYMLVFSIPILAHNPMYTSHTDADQLDKISECLSFILEPLLVQNDSCSLSFYKALLLSIKNRTDALDPENDEANAKMHAVCDVASRLLLLNRSKNFETGVYSAVPRLPRAYFKKRNDLIVQNTCADLPIDNGTQNTDEEVLVTEIIAAARQQPLSPLLLSSEKEKAIEMRMSRKRKAATKDDDSRNHEALQNPELQLQKGDLQVDDGSGESQDLIWLRKKYYLKELYIPVERLQIMDNVITIPLPSKKSQKVSSILSSPGQ